MFSWCVVVVARSSQFILKQIATSEQVHKTTILIRSANTGEPTQEKLKVVAAKSKINNIIMIPQ